jgi:hypothetical protein
VLKIRARNSYRRLRQPRRPLWPILASVIGLCTVSVAEPVKGTSQTGSERSWTEALLDARATWNTEKGALDQARQATVTALDQQFPMQSDWLRQDLGAELSNWLSSRPSAELEERLLTTVLAEIGDRARDLRDQVDGLRRKRPPAGDARWIQLYEQACAARRKHRLKLAHQEAPRVVFTKHYNLGGSHYAYTEGLSDAQNERHFVPGSALCLLEFIDGQPQVRTLIHDADGVIRDPDVSWDGDRILFAWKKSDREDDYHLYEYQMASGEIRQLTSGLGFADYEGAYLANGDIIFNSTRCVQTVDCWWTEVSNLYTCGPSGEHLRRLTFDQVHDNYPTVLPDGRVIYTRWEYNDRGQIYVQGLFQMNPDGTGQTEFYGNNSWFPTALLHARGIPGSEKVLAIFSGHHTSQAGKLGWIDPSRGRQENSGAQLIAPVRTTPAERIDAYGQDGILFQYPYPLSETECLVACAPLGWSRQPTLFQLYWVSADGRREWLTGDPTLSCNQPIPLRARPRPPIQPSSVDYRQTNGIVYLQDIFTGPGLSGVARENVRRLRVVALGYRAAGVGYNINAGPAGDALVSTPIAIGNGAWDTKTVLGDATVHADGSALFVVPARTPVYFQAVDEDGCVVQTMRSWTSLQPGETASCAGCHEHKNQAPTTARLSRALASGPEVLHPFHGPARAFSFAREIQPILDKHCIRCHNDSAKWSARLTATNPPTPPPSQDTSDESSAFSLRAVPVTDPLAKRTWTEAYLALTHARSSNAENPSGYAGTPNALVNWVGAQSVPEMLAPYASGAASSRLLKMLRQGHRKVALSSEELEKLACWIDLQVPFCGEYTEAAAWTAEEASFYQRFANKRRAMLELEQRNIDAYQQRNR